MRKYQLLFLLFFASIYSYGQNTEIDSILNALPESRDTNRILSLNNAFMLATAIDIEMAGALVREEREIAEELDNPKFLASTSNSLGIYYYYINELDSSISAFENALDIFEKLGLTSKASAALNNLGSLANAKGDFPLAADYGLRSLRIKESINDRAGIGTSLYTLGNTWTYMDKFEEAQEYYNRAIEIFEELGDEIAVGECLESLASIQDDFKNYREAIKIRKQAITIAEQHDQRYQLSLTLGNMGQSYSSIQDCDSALIYLNRALPLALEVGDVSGASIIKRTMGECYSKKGNSKKALSLINEALEESREFGFTERLSDDYWYLYDAQKRIMNFEPSLYALEKHMLLKDSTRGIETEAIVRDLETKYKTEKKEAEIKLLSKQTELDATKKKSLWGGMGLLTLLAGGIIYGQVQRRRRIQENAIKEKQIEIEKRKSAEQELEFKKKELTTKALQLASKNEFLNSLEGEINNLKSSVDATVSKTSQRISRLIHNDQLDDEEWQQFGKEFSSVHQDFLDRLKAKYGSFSKGEMRLIALLKMNLSSKDIANTLRISDDGIKKARYRLRKKLQLDSDRDIQSYLIGY